MKYVTLILIALALCAFAQNKDASSAPEEYSVRSAVGQPITGKADDGAHDMTAVVKYGERVAAIAKRLPDPDRPLAFGIGAITPNPFNPVCEIEFEIGETGEVILEIFDISGRLIATPFDEPEMSPGVYRISWDGGAENPSGTYLARLSAGGKTGVRRLVYLK